MLIHFGYTMYPYEVKVPKPPYDWFDPAPNTSKGGHTFDKVYNPGTWSSFYYLPEFLSKSQGGQYKFIVSQMAVSQFCQMNTTLSFLHIVGGFFSTKGGRRGKTRMV